MELTTQQKLHLVNAKIKIEQTKVINEAISLLSYYGIDSGNIGKRKRALPKYLNINTGETYSGRGRLPTWFGSPAMTLIDN